MANLLLVDDDPAFRNMLDDYLSFAGHRITSTGDGAGMRAALAADRFDLVLLDLNLPGEDGLSLSRHLREHHQVGIIMVTGVDQVVDRIVGLEVGADDYVTKPFNLTELAARIEAVLRRRLRLRYEMKRFGDCTMDLRGWRLLAPDGREIALAATELDLVAAFASNPGQVLSRDDILRLAPAQGDDPYDRSIDNRIARMRRKLEDEGLTGAVIRTVRGTGYLYEE